MITNEQALEAMKTLSDYCKQRGTCDGCIASDDNPSHDCMTQWGYPREWREALEGTMERQCPTCGSTDVALTGQRVDSGYYAKLRCNQCSRTVEFTAKNRKTAEKAALETWNKR